MKMTSVSAKMDGVFSPSVIGAQGSEGADTNLNLAADDLINSNSQHTLPLVHVQSELTQTAARPLSDATDCVTDVIDGIDSANSEPAIIDTTDSIVNSITGVNNLNETRQAAYAMAAERADWTQAHLTAANRHGPQRTVDREGRDTAARSTVDVNNAHAQSDSINDDRPMITPDQHGQESEAIVARQGVTGRQQACQSNPITADIPFDSADRLDNDLAVIVTRSGSAAASAGTSATDTNRCSSSGERCNKQGNKRGQQDEAERRDCSETGSACHSDKVKRRDTPNNPACDDLSGDNRIKTQKPNDMTERRDAETDLQRKFTELANIDMSGVNYDSEQTDALGDSENFG